MSYYIGFTYNDGNKDVIRMTDAQVAEAATVQIDRTVKDALALHILRYFGLSSASGIRSIDMVRHVPDGTVRCSHGNGPRTRQRPEDGPTYPRTP